jgi:hypothetical protein
MKCVLKKKWETLSLAKRRNDYHYHLVFQLAPLFGRLWDVGIEAAHDSLVLLFFRNISIQHIYFSRRKITQINGNFGFLILGIFTAILSAEKLSKEF